MIDPNRQDGLQFEFPELDANERLRELILHISEKCAGDSSFGATKLNKLLFFADFQSFFEYGEPITGAEYQKLPMGPAPRQLVPVRDAMEAKGEIKIEKLATYFNRQQHRCIPQRSADLSGFKGRDIELLDMVIQRFWGTNARDISELSHQRAWRIAKENESIPYEAVFLSDDDTLTAAEAEHLMALNREHRWE